MHLIQFLIEAKKKEKKIVFVETDPDNPFPNDTISSLRKEINKSSKDLTKEWKNASDLVNSSFNELDVPIPRAYQKERWKQYTDLLGYAVKNLYDARGFDNWVTTV